MINKIENRITFSDYDEEGVFVYDLSKIENKNPYLICCLEFKENEYRNYDVDSSKFVGDAWYLKETAKLKEVSLFEDIIVKNSFVEIVDTYIIYEIIDQEAYLNIWSMASSDFGIAETTISGNCNLDEVIKSLKQKKIAYSGDFNFDTSLVPWAYTQNYGGGSDEHYAVFYSKKKQYIDYIKRQVNLSRKSNLTGV